MNWPAACVTITLVSGKWTTAILAQLAKQPRRFADLRRSVGVSATMLDHTLDQMERDGLAARTVITVTPPTPGWRLTALGRSLAGPVAALAAWAVLHRAELPRTTLARAAKAFPIPPRLPARGGTLPSS